VIRTVCLLTMILCVPCPLHSADWPQWRGPGHNNLAPGSESAPTKWSKSKNVRWKAGIPGRGHSTPIVVGNLVLLTSADERSHVQAVIAYDRLTGNRKWLTPISKGGFPKIHTKNTHASPTMASSNGLFYATFCHHGTIEAVAVDNEGKIVWKQIVGPFAPKAFQYGYAASPTVYGQTLIVTGSCDTNAWMKALDLASGKVIWQQKRPQVLNWASPIVAEVNGKDQLLLSGGHMIAGYDPQTGNPAWKAECLTMATCGTCVWTDGIVIASGGFPDPQTAAVAADGSGHVLWTNRVKCYEQSTLCHNGYLYAFDDNGVAYCWNAKTGKEQWKSRLRGPVSASLLLVGDNIYTANERGSFFVFKASPIKFEGIAKNQLGTESFATPVVADNVLYLRVADGRGNRRQEMLYAIAE
jgi:outer membrane protein assembly factor BamB